MLVCEQHEQIQAQMHSVFEFINLFSNSVKNEADSVILFQQNKITSMSMNAQQKRTSFDVLLYGGREDYVLVCE